MNKEFIQKVAIIQQKLKAPKNQFNKFGNYKYRSCEDIMEGVKNLLGDLILTVGDDIQLIGDRIYVKATATITDGENSISNSAFARESLTKKGMDDSQITGTASSYARKYALNGLLCIDDTKDADSMNNSENKNSEAVASVNNALKNKDIKWISDNWTTVVAEAWPNLTPKAIEHLNKIASGE